MKGLGPYTWAIYTFIPGGISGGKKQTTLCVRMVCFMRGEQFSDLLGSWRLKFFNNGHFHYFAVKLYLTKSFDHKFMVFNFLKRTNFKEAS